MTMTKLNMSAMAVAVALLAACGTPETKVATTDTVTAPTVDTTAAPMPPAAPATVVDIAVGSADHTTLVAAVKAADLVATLSGPGPFTVFAPTNAAFDALPAGTVADLLKPENKAKLAGILTFHVVAGAVKSSDLTDGMKAKTVNGEELKFTVKEGKVTVNGANVTAADLTAGNGVVHVIDAVLLPKK
jgi:uncharacterized surface protein with fasciclin (FAS1) repeats